MMNDLISRKAAYQKLKDMQLVDYEDLEIDATEWDEE